MLLNEITSHLGYGDPTLEGSHRGHMGAEAEALMERPRQ